MDGALQAFRETPQWCRTRAWLSVTVCASSRRPPLTPPNIFLVPRFWRFRQQTTISSMPREDGGAGVGAEEGAVGSRVKNDEEVGGECVGAEFVSGRRGVHRLIAGPGAGRRAVEACVYVRWLASVDNEEASGEWCRYMSVFPPLLGLGYTEEDRPDNQVWMQHGNGMNSTSVYYDAYNLHTGTELQPPNPARVFRRQPPLSNSEGNVTMWAGFTSSILRLSTDTSGSKTVMPWETLQVGQLFEGGVAYSHGWVDLREGRVGLAHEYERAGKMGAYPRGRSKADWDVDSRWEASIGVDAGYTAEQRVFRDAGGPCLGSKSNPSKINASYAYLQMCLNIDLCDTNSRDLRPRRRPHDGEIVRLAVAGDGYEPRKTRRKVALKVPFKAMEAACEGSTHTIQQLTPRNSERAPPHSPSARLPHITSAARTRPAHASSSQLFDVPQVSIHDETGCSGPSNGANNQSSTSEANKGMPVVNGGTNAVDSGEHKSAVYRAQKAARDGDERLGSKAGDWRGTNPDDGRESEVEVVTFAEARGAGVRDDKCINDLSRRRVFCMVSKRVDDSTNLGGL
ncbi:hypothetical protein R3P38DRAFT_2774349 [Favolaschia claudopus]|uniref:Uncharacterized protein n=1 Tax=Favolaschia claudopus TaxID=2862362 RepID=A0AAW0BZ43_9AGAR